MKITGIDNHRSTDEQLVYTLEAAVTDEQKARLQSVCLHAGCAKLQWIEGESLAVNKADIKPDSLRQLMDLLAKV